MLLSEAILLGSIGTKQGFFYGMAEDTACALEAACIAIGIDRRKWSKLSKQWPWLHQAPADCPVCQEKPRLVEEMDDLIWHLNDVHQWTRPCIAAWVAEQEVKLGIVDQVEAEVKEGEHAPA